MRILFLSFLITLSFAKPSLAQEQALPLPRLTHVGVIPVQWENDADDLLSQKLREKLAPAFPQAVRDAKRFRVVNDQVVADLWSNPQGRRELVKSYELNAFVSLTAKRLSDGIRLTSRLLSPELDNYLVETETVSRADAMRFNDQGLRERLEGLIFRLFNRLPVDVVVTSVQGRFISISGGAEQGMKTGDSLQFFRTSITSQHPANGSWLSFDNKPLGDAKIIEVNRYSAVAKLVSLSYENAIKVGDGAKIPAIQSRSSFARFAKQDAETLDDNNGSAIIVPPLYPSRERKGQSLLDEVGEYRDEAGKQAADKAPAKPTPAALAKSPVPSQAPAEAKSKESALEPPPEKAELSSDGDDQKHADDTGKWKEPGGQGKTPAFFEPFANAADVVQVHAGPRLWSTSGVGGGSSRLPFWLFNNVGILGEKTMFSPQTKFGFAGDLGYGPTGNGSFFSLSGEAKGILEQPLQGLFEHAQFFRLGLTAKYTKVSVSKESFGGMAHIRIGLLGGLRGVYPMSGHDALDWSVNATFYPQAFGTVKASGRTREITNYSGFHALASGYIVGQRRSLEWGGILGYGLDYYKLDKRSMSANDLYLAASGRVRF